MAKGLLDVSEGVFSIKVCSGIAWTGVTIFTLATPLRLRRLTKYQISVPVMTTVNTMMAAIIGGSLKTSAILSFSFLSS